MKFYLILGVVGVLGLGAHQFFLLEANRDLREAVAELDGIEPRWRLEDIDADRKKIPDEKNSARIVIETRQAFPENFFEIFQSLEDAEKVPPPFLLKPELEQKLFIGTKNLEEVIARARRLADFPMGRYPLSFTPDFISTLLHHQQNARDVANVLLWDVRALMQKGDIEGAWKSNLAILNCGRSLGDEPLLISMLIRASLDHLFKNSLERTLALGEAKEPDLARMRKAAAEEAAENLFLTGLRGERAGLHHLFSNIENGQVQLSRLQLGRMENTFDSIQAFAAQPLVRTSHAWLLRHMTGAITIAREPGPRTYKKLRDLEESFHNELAQNKITLIFAKLLLPAYFRLFEREQRRGTNLHCTVAALAVEQYRIKHQKWPQSLVHLVHAGLLQEVPPDHFTGQPLRYRQTRDGVVIYSVGPKGNYQGDALDNLENYDQDVQRIEFRLWNPERRRQKPG